MSIETKDKRKRRASSLDRQRQRLLDAARSSDELSTDIDTWAAFEFIMGAKQSSLKPAPPECRFFCITLTKWNRINIIYAQRQEVDVIRNAIANNWPRGIKSEKADYKGTQQFKVNGNPFASGASASRDAIQSRKMMGEMLFGLFRLGGRVMAAADLVRSSSTSTVFFRRGAQPDGRLVREDSPGLACISLSSSSTLQLINCPERLHGIVRAVVVETWKMGVEEERMKDDTYCIKMNGNPWAGGKDQSVQCRLLIANIIKEFAMNQWFLYTTLNLKGTSDSIYFIHDPVVKPEPECFFVLSLNRQDRLRLISAPQDVVSTVRNVCKQMWTDRGGVQKEKDYHGSWEFKLSGHPWCSSGKETIQSRLLILSVVESLFEQGWCVHTSIDVSRSTSDKSTIIFRKVAPFNGKVMCLSPNDTNKLRFLKVPPFLTDASVDIIRGHWRSEVTKAKKSSDVCFKVNMSGFPWVCCDESLFSISFLCVLNNLYEQFGWRLLFAADVSARRISSDDDEWPEDVHSLYFVCGSRNDFRTPPVDENEAQWKHTGVNSEEIQQQQQQMKPSAPPIHLSEAVV